MTLRCYIQRDSSLNGGVQCSGVNFNLTASREMISNLYVNLGVTEAYDSDPTAAGANKNDFSFTTSFGWWF